MSNGRDLPELYAVTLILSQLIREHVGRLPAAEAKDAVVRMRACAVNDVGAARWLDAYGQARALNTIAALFKDLPATPAV